MTVPPATRTVHIALGGGYDVLIGPGILNQTRGRATAILGREGTPFILHDRGLPDSLLKPLAASAKVHSWSPSESDKSPEHATKLLEVMAREGMDRSGFVIALGGGITGDMGGFLAAIYQRGIPWINCPTTLLSMVDSAIGGKTGVNLTLRGEGEPVTLKNMVGAFHQPILVVADTSALNSLPERAFRSGLAECIKHTFIAADWRDPGLFDWTRSNLPLILRRDPSTLTELIARNITLKGTVVESDVRETGDAPGGGRMALNLGHTFAHAFEPLPGLSPDGNPAHAPLQHGEAVALGLIAAAHCSAAAGLCPGSLPETVRALVHDCGLPTSIRGLPSDESLISRMSHDKKSRAGHLRLILPTSPGHVRLITDPPLDAVRAGLASIRA